MLHGLNVKRLRNQRSRREKEQRRRGLLIEAHEASRPQLGEGDVFFFAIRLYALIALLRNEVSH